MGRELQGSVGLGRITEVLQFCQIPLEHASPSLTSILANCPQCLQKRGEGRDYMSIAASISVLTGRTKLLHATHPTVPGKLCPTSHRIACKPHDLAHGVLYLEQHNEQISEPSLIHIINKEIDSWQETGHQATLYS